jgi:IS30 family transposase
VYEDRPDLKEYLRCKKRKYRKRHGTLAREEEREKAKKKWIDTRPEIVETRQRIGDWEGDTIRGGDRKSAVLTHVERKSGYLLANRLERALAEKVRLITVETFEEIPRKKKFSITYDNGSEFAEHATTEIMAQIAIYFANAYHSWERGTNENTNGLLRQFFPKGTDFTKITDSDLQEAVELINNRPRKRLNYHTPKEVFSGQIAFRSRI